MKLLTTAEILAECERVIALSEKATPGPWQTNAVPQLGSVANGVFTNPADDEAPEIFVCSVKPRWEEGCAVDTDAIANAEFIAAARESLPRLARLVTRLVEERRWLSKWTDDVRCCLEDMKPAAAFELIEKMQAALSDVEISE